MSPVGIDLNIWVIYRLLSSHCASWGNGYELKYLSLLILDVHVTPKLMPCMFTDSWYISWWIFSATCPSQAEAITNKANRGYTCHGVSCITMEFYCCLLFIWSICVLGWSLSTEAPINSKEMFDHLYSLQPVIYSKTKVGVKIKRSY